MDTLYKFENDNVERILSCTCTVLCYILEYIYIVHVYWTNSKYTQKSVVCFQHAKCDNAFYKIWHSVWLCMLEVNTGLVRLFAICPT